MNLKLLQLNRLRISYFRILVVPVVIVTNGFLICLGRPSADEYLLGPILNGFYIDSPNGTLFNPSSNLIIRYFQGTKAFVALGWIAECCNFSNVFIYRPQLLRTSSFHFARIDIHRCSLLVCDTDLNKDFWNPKI